MSTLKSKSARSVAAELLSEARRMRGRSKLVIFFVAQAKALKYYYICYGQTDREMQRLGKDYWAAHQYLLQRAKETGNGRVH